MSAQDSRVSETRKGESAQDATPRPWRVVTLAHCYHDNGCTHYDIHDADGNAINTVPFSDPVLPGLIVRAVNSHDPLVAALRWYARGIKSVQTEQHDQGLHIRKPHEHCPFCDGGARAREALRLAGEKV